MVLSDGVVLPAELDLSNNALTGTLPAYLYTPGLLAETEPLVLLQVRF